MSWLGWRLSWQLFLIMLLLLLKVLHGASCSLFVYITYFLVLLSFCYRPYCVYWLLLILSYYIYYIILLVEVSVESLYDYGIYAPIHLSMFKVGSLSIYHYLFCSVALDLFIHFHKKSEIYQQLHVCIVCLCNILFKRSQIIYFSNIPNFLQVNSR